MNTSEDSDSEGRSRTARLSGWRQWPRRPVIAIVAVMAVGASLLIPASRHQWALSIIRQPTRYTALAFRYAWLLPSTTSMDQRVPVFFTVSNQEGQATKYRYVLREVDP